MKIRAIYGQGVIDALEAEKLERVKPSQRVPGCFESESLCRWQSDVHQRGYRGAELVKSIYGWSVRSDTGLENFMLYAGARAGQLDGSLADARRWAREWLLADPKRRYVWSRDPAAYESDDDLEEGNSVSRRNANL